MKKRILKYLLTRFKNYFDNLDLMLPPAITKFDNDGHWTSAMFLNLLGNKKLWHKPQYVWGTLQAAALAKSLNYKSISFIEFGVAAGKGIKVLDEMAVILREHLNLEIEVYGFDTGKGMIPPGDYRDLPNLFREGEYGMDYNKLIQELKRTSLKMGVLEETLPRFLVTDHAPIAFMSFDLDYYSSTKHAFQIFQKTASAKLPRVLLYFDDIFVRSYCEFNGPLLAIREFNDENENLKICKVNGLRYFLPIDRNWAWPDAMYYLHDFKHEKYNERELGTIVHS